MIINSNTLLPLGIVSTSAAFLVGGIMWLSDISHTAKANAAEIKKLNNIQTKIDNVSQRLARIEGKLTIIIEQSTNKE